MAAVCDLVCDEDIHMRKGEYKLLCNVVFIGWGPKNYPIYIGITKKNIPFLITGIPTKCYKQSFFDLNLKPDIKISTLDINYRRDSVMLSKWAICHDDIREKDIRYYVRTSYIHPANKYLANNEFTQGVELLLRAQTIYKSLMFSCPKLDKRIDEL